MCADDVTHRQAVGSATGTLPFPPGTILWIKLFISLVHIAKESNFLGDETQLFICLESGT